ncbi:MAG: UbiA family prenyltransferase [Pseudomonadota bacterium]
MPLPLYVDLDGSLSRTDTLHEMTILLLSKNLLYIVLLPIWLSKGIANLKQQISFRVDLDVANLPYDKRVVDIVHQARQNKSRTILLTAADQSVADSVSSHLGLFDSAIGSNGTTNMKGDRKLDFILSDSNSGFEYVGNSKEDVAILQKAANGYFISGHKGLIRQLKNRACGKINFLEDTTNSLRAVRKSLRLHQWIKNSLVFVPILLDHQLMHLATLTSGLLAFLSFSLCASAIYLLNDLLDVRDDRKHSSKRHRPIAAGELTVSRAVALLFLLLGLSGVLASLLPMGFAITLGAYVVITTAYSARLKRVPVLDVLILAGLFTTRILAGKSAAGIENSFWLLSFGMFVFLSLALVKRYSELEKIDPAQIKQMPGRGYKPEDLDLLSQVGTSSACMAVLVLALYINSPEVKQMYSHPEAIWLLCPLMLYVLIRVWLLTRRGVIDDDPVIFILNDSRSLVAAALAFAILWIAA